MALLYAAVVVQHPPTKRRRGKEREPREPPPPPFQRPRGKRTKITAVPIVPVVAIEEPRPICPPTTDMGKILHHSLLILIETIYMSVFQFHHDFRYFMSYLPLARGLVWMYSERL